MSKESSEYFYGYITFRKPFTKTMLKKWGKKPKVKKAPPKFIPIIFNDDDIESYKCEACQILKPEDELLMCDFKVNPQVDVPCDRMVCFDCAQIDKNNIPEGDWYCEIH